MNVLFFVGRILFVLIFIVSGASKLMDISSTASMISGKIVIPQELSGLATQVEGATGMTVPQLLAIAAGVVELGAGLMLAVNFGSRIAALLLIGFTVAATFYFHDFWNQVGADRTNNMVHAMKNVSIVGALLVFFVLGAWRPSIDDETIAEPAPR